MWLNATVSALPFDGDGLSLDLPFQGQRHQKPFQRPGVSTKEEGHQPLAAAAGLKRRPPFRGRWRRNIDHVTIPGNNQMGGTAAKPRFLAVTSVFTSLHLCKLHLWLWGLRGAGRPSSLTPPQVRKGCGRGHLRLKTL